jgi:hypothetical protein
MDDSERRRSVRIRFAGKALLRYGHNLSLETEVDTRNISLHGVFIETSAHIPLGTACDIIIHLRGATSTMDFRAQGVIQRHDPTGLAVAFTCIDPDSYLHVFNLVKLHEAQ